MHRSHWWSLAFILIIGLSVGCSSSSTTSKPVTPANTGPKADEGKSKAGMGGLENPPPP